jgi:hypothetical protein
MSVNASRVSTQFDTADAVTLRDLTDGAETATATEAAISLSELDEAYWHANEIPHGVMEIGIIVTALDRGTGDETYVLSLQVDDTANHADTPITVHSITVGAVGFYRLFLDSKSIPTLDSDSSGTDKWLAIKVTLAGTTPSITYGAWIARARRA